MAHKCGDGIGSDAFNGICIASKKFSICRESVGREIDNSGKEAKSKNAIFQVCFLRVEHNSHYDDDNDDNDDVVDAVADDCNVVSQQSS